MEAPVEFLAHTHYQVHCLFGRRPIAWEDVPRAAIERIREYRREFPKVAKWVDRQPGTFDGDVIKKTAYYAYGELNNTPDIDIDGTVNPECASCDLLSPSEMRVLKLVHLEDSEIAEILCISILTVKAHWKNIRRKTGKKNKIELAAMAAKQNII